MNDKQFPIIPQDLLEELDQLFPDRCPSLSDSIDMIRHKAGQRSVINFLTMKFKEQEADTLSRSVIDV